MVTPSVAAPGDTNPSDTAVPDMTYDVFGGTLSLPQSINQPLQGVVTDSRENT